VVEVEITMKQKLSDKNLIRIIYVLITLSAILCLLPVLNVFSTAFSGATAVEAGMVSLWPVDFTFQSFNLLVSGTNAMRATWNSVVITVVGTIFSMIMTILAAYPLSKKYFIGNKFFTKMIVFTMLFSGGMIPTYIVVQKFGLIDSYLSLWLTGAINTYNMIVMRTFFNNIPKEMNEAAEIDGCGEYRLLIKIYLPLSLPVLATLTLFYGVGHWNTFMSALLYINDAAKQNLSVLVQQMIKSMSVLTNEITNADPLVLQSITSAGIRAAGVVVMILPMMLVYPFLQKYFVKGIMLGGIKG
jgi:putative aldouronate transport system permease protein